MYILLGMSMNIAHKRKKPAGSNPVRYILCTFEFIYAVMGSQWNTQTKMSHDKDRRGQILRHVVTFHIQMTFPILVT